MFPARACKLEESAQRLLSFIGGTVELVHAVNSRLAREELPELGFFMPGGCEGRGGRKVGK